MSEPHEPRIGGNGYWFSKWTGPGRQQRMKRFGHSSKVTEEAALQRFQQWRRRPSIAVGRAPSWSVDSSGALTLIPRREQSFKHEPPQDPPAAARTDEIPSTVHAATNPVQAAWTGALAELDRVMDALDRIRLSAEGRRLTHDAVFSYQALERLAGISGRLAGERELVASEYCERFRTPAPAHRGLAESPLPFRELERRSNRPLAAMAPARLPPAAPARAALDTFGDLWNAYLADARRRKKPHTVAEEEALFQQHLRPWSCRPAASITPADVQSLTARVGKDAPIEAKRLLMLLSIMFKTIGHRFGVPRHLLPTEGMGSPRGGYEPHPREAPVAFAAAAL